MVCRRVHVDHVNGVVTTSDMSDKCEPVRVPIQLYCCFHYNSTLFQRHNTFAAILTTGLCVGLILSYLPQVRPSHYVLSTYVTQERLALPYHF